MSAHTPGPWVKLGEQINGADDTMVADVWNDADARLIAAAPELLEAVQKAHEYRAEPDKLAVVVSRFSSLILKATGATS